MGRLQGMELLLRWALVCVEHLLCALLLFTLFNSNNPRGVNISINPLLQIKKPQLREDEKSPLCHIANKKQSYDLDPSVSAYKFHVVTLLVILNVSFRTSFPFSFTKDFQLITASFTPGVISSIRWNKEYTHS